MSNRGKQDVKISYSLSFSAKLGCGPLQSVVYKGRFSGSKRGRNPTSDKSMNLSVLIKKIPTKILADAVDWSAHRYLDHPNVASYKFVHEERNYFSRDVNYIIQDYHEYTLQGLIDGGYSFIQFNTNMRKNAVRDIGQGLNYLHLSRNLVHGNLKTSNVLIKLLPKGECRFVITDYWYSNHLSFPNNSLTMAQRFGTESKSKSDDHDETMRIADDNNDDTRISKWVAPEVKRIKDPLPYSSKSDIFSFALVIQDIFPKNYLFGFSKTDYILCNHLIALMMHELPKQRLSCRDLLAHPLVQLRSAGDRIRYISDACTDIQSDTLLGRHVEGYVKALVDPDNSMFPWSLHVPQLYDYVSKNVGWYDPLQFLDLLRLIKDTAEQPPPRSNKLYSSIFLHDLFNERFPDLLGLLYCALIAWRKVSKSHPKLLKEKVRSCLTLREDRSPTLPSKMRSNSIPEGDSR